MATRTELLGLGRAEDKLESTERLKRLEGIVGLLVSDQAIGNVLKGPFRLPDSAQPSRAFQ